ncbi:Protein of unknown function (DUF3102) [Desulfitobacterium sp. LBE]|uniref:Protein export cytoplasm protein SecA ATPase RNA helicase n=1 Tax=Desulfitobacterium hafniense (strain DSM 10664 / DCB-2) TaxID=272564 RepID=B8G0X5_DESHD|nr:MULTISPECIES: DUF3102 domain-containing protein [Desulfitobacterium]ACL18394.1 conserved hypothetical protein [Desulfitobacterium hafniense DCB-2]TWH58679.1 Protein of unknown function (DUF3102) [Desulfitobacterium sp. LBE]
MRMENSNRTPGQIASEINVIKEQSGKMLLSNAIEIGRRLTEAKELVPHGEWLKWLTESVSYSRSTASRLMKIFREYGPILSSTDGEEGSNGAPVHHLNYTQGIALFGISVEDRDQFIADNDVGKMSKRELQQTVKVRERTAEEEERREPENQGVQNQEKTEEAADKAMDKPLELIPVERKIIKPKTVPTAQTELQQEDANPESMKYNAQYATHRDTMLSAYGELLKTLVALNRVDPVKKEANRKEALKITTNMAETLKQYPPAIKTNLKIKRTEPGAPN